MLNVIGGGYHDVGDYERAQNYHQQALELYEGLDASEADGTVMGARAMDGLGTVFQSMGRHRPQQWRQACVSPPLQPFTPAPKANGPRSLSNYHPILQGLRDLPARMAERRRESELADGALAGSIRCACAVYGSNAMIPATWWVCALAHLENW